MGSRKSGRLKHKNHAQDCETLTRDQHPAILPWFLYFGWRPSFRKSRAPARFAQRPDCCWTSCLSVVLPEKPVSGFPDHALAHDCLSRIRENSRKLESPVLGKSCENARQKRA
jgi:hypothetical protein